MTKLKNIYVTIILIVLTSNYGILFSQWATDPTINNPICVAANDQDDPAITTDGEGGAIIAWVDNRGNNSDIYAQRIDKTGNIKWTLDGIAVCNANFSQIEPDLVSDGYGGAIIFWKDFRTGIDYDLYAQRIDSTGNIKWQTNGVQICTATGYQEDFNVASDGTNGAIIVWEDARVQGNFNIYAQRISNDGNVVWQQNGISVCSANNDQYRPTIIADLSAGCIITWEDNRGGVYSDIYAQKLNANGEPQWTVDGIPICSATDSQGKPKLTTDGAGGAVIVWRDHRTGFYDLYIQLVNSLGVTQWQSNGVRLLQGQSYPPDRVQIVSDNTGGAIVCWDEDRTEMNYDIFAQRVDNSGTLLWIQSGLGVCQAQMGQTAPAMIEDGDGGAIITWYDYRNVSNWDIYAQRVNAGGEFLWQIDGVQVSGAIHDQINPVIASDTDNGSIIAWDDYRNITDENIYAQRINKDGVLGNPTNVGNENDKIPTEFTLLQNYPNPFNPSTTITFSIPTEEFVSLEVFNSLGEKIEDLVNETKPAGNYSVSFDASKLTSGIYFYNISTGNFFQTRKMMLVK